MPKVNYWHLGPKVTLLGLSGTLFSSMSLPLPRRPLPWPMHKTNKTNNISAFALVLRHRQLLLAPNPRPHCALAHRRPLSVLWPPSHSIWKFIFCGRLCRNLASTAHVHQNQINTTYVGFPILPETQLKPASLASCPTMAWWYDLQPHNSHPR